MKSVQQITEEVNKLRLESLDILFKKKSLEEKFKVFPYGIQFMNALLKDKFIIQQGKFYQFSKQPIHLIRIETFLENMRLYYREYYKRKRIEQQVKNEIHECNEMSLKEIECIKYLMDLGYKIYKPQ